MKEKSRPTAPLAQPLEQQFRQGLEELGGPAPIDEAHPDSLDLGSLLSNIVKKRNASQALKAIEAFNDILNPIAEPGPVKPRRRKLEELLREITNPITEPGPVHPPRTPRDPAAGPGPVGPGSEQVVCPKCGHEFEL